MRIHLVSDLHLELSKSYPTYLSKVEADTLVLAGDIGKPFTDKYENFIDYCAKLFKHVIIVAGNHEYYQSKLKKSMLEIDNRIKEICDKHDNTYFLQRSSIVIDNIRFVGCTLWSLCEKYANKTNDFDNIKHMTIATYLQLHMSDSKYLDNILDTTTYFTVVVTHHVPSYKLINSKYKGDITNSFYASHLDHIISKANVWLCGHTHSSLNMVINNCQCVINAYGYPSERREDTGFDPDLIIDLPST